MARGCACGSEFLARFWDGGFKLPEWFLTLEAQEACQ